MAEQDAILSPLCVTTDDEVPAGYVKVTLVLPELKVKSTMTLKKKLDNGDLQVKFEDRSLLLDVKLNEKKTNKHYQFEVKKLPGEIVPGKSYHKVKKEQVILYLCKEKQKPWTRELSSMGLETFSDD